jgi:hypothetical protein
MMEGHSIQKDDQWGGRWGLSYFQRGLSGGIGQPAADPGSATFGWASVMLFGKRHPARVHATCRQLKDNVPTKHSDALGGLPYALAMREIWVDGSRPRMEFKGNRAPSMATCGVRVVCRSAFDAIMAVSRILDPYNIEQLRYIRRLYKQQGAHYFVCFQSAIANKP